MKLPSIDPAAIFLVIAIIVVIALVVGAILFLRRMHRRRMQKRFGPEYERLAAEMGSHKRAEARLLKRAGRVAGYNIHPLREDDRMRYLRVWRGVQAKFVEHPGEAVAKADQLLTEAMADRGYPMAEFERRSADLSIHYPMVVQNYRAAHEIALRHCTGTTSTEDLRQAMIHYRTLFTELVSGEPPTDSREAA